MSKQKIDAAAAYLYLQCVADVVRAIPERPDHISSSQSFVEAVRLQLQRQDPDMLNPLEEAEMKNLHDLFVQFVEDPTIWLPNLLPSA